MTGVEILFINEESGPPDPWGSSTASKSKLNKELVGQLVQGSADGLSDVTAALALLHLADNELRAYGTTGDEELQDAQIRLVLRALQATAARVGVTISLPFRDFSGFRSYWGRNDGYGSWQARREMVDGFFADAFDKLEDSRLEVAHLRLRRRRWRTCVTLQRSSTTSTASAGPSPLTLLKLSAAPRS